MKQILENYLPKTNAWLEDRKARKARLIIQRRTYKELSSLTDYELCDIGISRGEIYDISRSVK